MKIKSELAKIACNILGWHTRRKIVVIESDDWGSIRMPSKEVYDLLLKKGIRVDRCHYCQNDSLASESDLSGLFEVLTSYKDKNSRYPVMTANTVVANPDFSKIENDQFTTYYCEPFTKTLGRYPEHAHSFNLWKEGLQSRIFSPQFHGREHLNISRWMYALQHRFPETMFAFENRLFGITTTITSERRGSYMAAYDYDNENEREKQLVIIKEGIDLFFAIFNNYPGSFIAPNYKWDPYIEPILYRNRIKSIQGVCRRSTIQGDGLKKWHLRYTGKLEKSNLIALVRNAFFEPSQNPRKDWVDQCMHDIETSFRWNKPAIICSHRVNYIGSISPANRDMGLKLLNTLLKNILHKWSDVEFLSSEELSDEIQRNTHRLCL